MALTFSSADQAVISQASLAALKSKDKLLAMVTHNYLGADTTTRTAVRVLYQNKTTGSIWNSTTGYASQTPQTINGLDIVFTEPVFQTDEISPNQFNSYDIAQLSTVIVPNQVEAVLVACRGRVQSLVNATTFPTQYSTSGSATFDFVQSGSQECYNSGSGPASQFTVVSQRFDRSLQSSLKTDNYLVGAQIINGQFTDSYRCGNTTVVPSYDLTTYSTNAEAVVMVPDAIVAAARLPNVQQVLASVAVVDPSTNFPILHYTWIHPINQTLNFTTAVQFNAAKGRGIGARLKLN
jgi:hypothetical protein